MSYETQRGLMVERHLRARGIRDERVLAAMGSIARELFVPERYRAHAYDDEPLPIGEGQTISQPFMTALMAQLLRLTGTENVLEVGAGCGYSAAVLGALAARVVTIERVPELAEMARRNLAAFANVLVVKGDGSAGYAPLAPFDAISVAAASAEVPPALEQQLADPGWLVIPVGPENEQELRVVRKAGGVVESRVATHCRFVPLIEPG
ncbi:MAG TPA: protein-L-isoaspartate(D-aspartate) O-methyltransferase [Bryobacteraceae bacterium]|nr:protein-L-isoaspartate(D-aspartate) O-methyltransferase [Bryobacteraceae bacterium]